MRDIFNNKGFGQKDVYTNRVRISFQNGRIWNKNSNMRELCEIVCISTDGKSKNCVLNSFEK